MMTNTTARTIARTMTTATLIHVAKVLETELTEAFRSGIKTTQAHVGKLELLNACTDEIVDRIEQIATA